LNSISYFSAQASEWLPFLGSIVRLPIIRLDNIRLNK
jgi:hypothetical protein